MIRVMLQAEPAQFDREVRKKGLAYLMKKEIRLDRPLPAKSELYSFIWHEAQRIGLLWSRRPMSCFKNIVWHWLL